MRLDYDYVRTVLLAIEEHTGVGDDMLFIPVSFMDIEKALDESNRAKLFYTIGKLVEAGFIKTDWRDSEHRDLMFYFVYDLTFAGHEYLNSVRDPKVWRAIKSVVGLTLKSIPLAVEKYLLTKFVP